MKPSLTLETARLLFRQPRVSDAKTVFDLYAHDPMVTKYLLWKPHSNIEETRGFLEKCETFWNEGKAYPYLIILKADPQLIMGMIQFRYGEQGVDIGYVLAQHFWGYGYMTESVQNVMDWALDQTKIYRVWALCHKANVSSIRVLERVGMQKEGLLRRWRIFPNLNDEPQDCYCYSKTK